MKEQVLIGLAIAIALVNSGFAGESRQAALISVSQRSLSAKVGWKNTTRKEITVDQHRGGVVLLDLWATWCGGCKEELPWFVEFEASFKPMGFSTIAVPMDDGGWSTVHPFVSTPRMPGTVVVDGSTSAKVFNIQVMPVALLIDRKGRVAAKYVGLVDRRNVQ